jgi:hypothetical protein
MFKSIIAIVAFAAVSLAGSIAAAEETSSANVVTELLVKNPGLAQCIAQCQAQTQPPNCTPADQTALNVARAKARAGVSVYESKLSRLSAGQLELSDELERQKDETRAALEALRDQMDTLNGYHQTIVTGLSELQTKVDEHEREITTLQTDVNEIKGDVADHEGRIAALESKQASLGLGGRLVGLGICSGDGTCYTGLAVGPRFGLNIGNDSVVVDAQAMTGFTGDTPYGVRMRGGYVLDLSRNWDLETGISATFADLDDELDARAAFMGADLGATLKMTELVNLGASLFGGVELDQTAPSGAYGGSLTLGGDLPL